MVLQAFDVACDDARQLSALALRAVEAEVARVQLAVREREGAIGKVDAAEAKLISAEALLEGVHAEVRAARRAHPRMRLSPSRASSTASNAAHLSHTTAFLPCVRVCACAFVCVCVGRRRRRTAPRWRSSGGAGHPTTTP